MHTRSYKVGYLLVFLSGKAASRKDLGLPENWEHIEGWLYGESEDIPTTDGPKSVIATKWPEIPVLNNYSKKPEENSGKSFRNVSFHPRLKLR
jgi:hypothetical protein